MRILLLLGFLSACTSASNESEDTSLAGSGTGGDSAGSDDSGSSGDSGGSGSPDIPDGTNGTIPDSALEAPEFAATNRDGGARAREDLLGHPTVMWFYPAASTPG
jgi:hypothetical protein